MAETSSDEDQEEAKEEEKKDLEAPTNQKSISHDQEKVKSSPDEETAVLVDPNAIVYPTPKSDGAAQFVGGLQTLND